MKSKLVYKFIVGYIVIAVVSFITVSLVCSKLTYKKVLSDEADHLYREAATIATTYGNNYYNGSLTLLTMRNELGAVSAYLGSDILFISYDGSIILNTDRDNPTESVPFDSTDSADRYRIDTFYGLFDSERLITYYPLEANYKIIGYIVICKPVADIKAVSDNMLNYSYISFGITLILCGIFFVILKIRVLTPVRRMNSVTDSYAKGDFSKRLKFAGNDELCRMGASLDYMAGEIENISAYQNRIIANVSHDFRSPLTSIKGYLEAMLDGTIPPEMYERYLGIVLSETERLTKLTNNLLALNNSNERGMLLDVSEFDIVTIIKKTIETFEGTCAKKRIKFSLVFSAAKLVVTADQAKIQQVMYNLVDNAIKFSNSDSSIIVSATETGDKVLISVKDFGIGIPKESLSKIWERFYKSDLSRGKDKKGTGLGLSIVKDIITAHKEYIDVVSTEGVGTEFTFALPLVRSSD